MSKFVSFTDVHGSLPHTKKICNLAKRSKADFLVSAGDISVFNRHFDESLEEFRKLGLPLYFVIGNHDEEIAASLVNKYPFMTDITNKLTRHNGIQLFGLPGTFEFGSVLSEGDTGIDWEMDKHLSDINPAQPLLFVSHYPPYATKCDTVIRIPSEQDIPPKNEPMKIKPIKLENYLDEIAEASRMRNRGVLQAGNPGGSKKVRELTERYNPKILFCGHYHLCFGQEDRIGTTRIINPSPNGLLIELD